MAELIIMAVVVLSALGLIAWLVHRDDARIDQTLAAQDIVNKTREQLDAAILDAERSKFSLMAVQATLNSETARANALEELIGKDIKNESTAADLAPDDDLARVARMSARWGAANVPGATGPVPAVASGELHQPDPAPAAVAPAVPKP